jgi:PTH1 family peptidyl-tRNA hydrolase
MPDRFLIVGLGNPGREYRENRHNVGFQVLDALAGKLGQTFTRRQADALYATGLIDAAPVVLAKPQRYMNLSGRPVASLVKFYDIPLARLLVIFDEIDLPLGTLRLRPEGGTAGHRGMESIVEALGTQEFPRLRVGVGRPPGRRAASSYVLKNFDKEEKPVADEMIERAVSAVESFVLEGITVAMNRFNADAGGET